MSADHEMKDIESDKQPLSPPENPSIDIHNLTIADLKKNVTLVEKTALTKEPRFLIRVLRRISANRKKLNHSVLNQIILHYFPPASKEKDLLISYLQKSSDDMEIDNQEKKNDAKNIHIEVEVYLHLLVIIFLIDKAKFEEATSCSSLVIKRLQAFNSRTLFPLGAKCFFYYSRSFELTGRLSEIRGTLLAAQRTATLRHDEEGQATIINLLLRSYLHYNLYEQAYKLAIKSTFPEAASSSQLARYLYYQGRIKAIQLEYTEAYKALVQALRKAPQTSAKGFRLTVSKLLCIVQLLLGELPERSSFRQSGLQIPLRPYLQLTKAVRVGDLNEFHNVVDRFADVFKKDKTYTLIQRLHHNVIKTGLRKINLSYSRIHMADVCAKLHLDSVDDAEFIVAKAIRDGVIEASINHTEGYIQSKETLDVYATQEPQEAFHKRISFCLNIRNEAVKAMRFPPDAHKPNKESEEARKERLKQEQELAKNLAEEDEEEDEDF